MLASVLAIRFVLELTLLAAFAWVGYRFAGGGPVGIAVGLLAVIGVAIVWGLLLSPKARIQLRPPVRTAVELVVFVVAAVALAATGHLLWGVLLLAADVLVLFALRQLGSTTGGEPAG